MRPTLLCRLPISIATTPNVWLRQGTYYLRGLYPRPHVKGILPVRALLTIYLEMLWLNFRPRRSNAAWLSSSGPIFRKSARPPASPRADWPSGPGKKLPGLRFWRSAFSLPARNRDRRSVEQKRDRRDRKSFSSWWLHHISVNSFWAWRNFFLVAFLSIRTFAC